MIRALVKAESQIISIRIPQSYIGRQIEILAFCLDEVESLAQNPSENTLAKDWISPEEDEAWRDL